MRAAPHLTSSSGVGSNCELGVGEVVRECVVCGGSVWGMVWCVGDVWGV